MPTDYPPTDRERPARPRRGTIVVVGIDGAGKTTAAAALVASEREAGRPAVLMRNVSGRRGLSRLGARLGASLPPRWADRAETVVRIANVLASHARASRFDGLVLMDRHLHCQLALRTVRGLPRGRVLPFLAGRLPQPDTVVLLDVPAETAHARILARGEDEESLGYLRAFRAAYLEVAEAEGWHVVDGTGTPERVVEALRDAARHAGHRRGLAANCPAHPGILLP